MDAGEALFRQGDEAHDWFVVLNGRLRSVVSQDSGKKAVSCALYYVFHLKHWQVEREYGRHETLGEYEMLTDSTRSVGVFSCLFFSSF
jgi:CRP-like cAMP-binding protein